MLDHARQFISAVLPWPQEGEAVYCNIHWRTLASNQKLYWDGRATQGVDEFIKTLGWALKQPDIKDLYVCMSQQSVMEQKTSAKGYGYKKAVRSSENATFLKSFFIDVDVKDGAYETTELALSALQAFIGTTGLPMPTAVVATGSGGFHCHWVLHEAIPKEEWLVLATALARATNELGLMTDSQVTIDAARILRIPDTFNNKTDLPREVTLLSFGDEVSLDDMKVSLEKYIAPIRIPSQKLKVNDELGAGIEIKAKPIKINDVAKSCAFIKRTLDTGGAENRQPLWFLTASVATFTEEGSDALHSMSSGHPNYDAANTDELYNRVKETQVKKGVGWPRCDKIAGYGAPECMTCPLRALNKSPLNHALPMASDKPDNTLPDMYFRNNEGLIFKRVIDQSGASISVQISSYPMWDAWLSNNPWTLHFMTVTGTGNRSRMEIPTEIITSKDGLSKYLGGKGVFMSDHASKIYKEFLLSWITKLQNTKDAVVSSSPFGWSFVDGKIEGFSYGGRVWTPSEDRPAVNPDPNLSFQYSPKGDGAHWLSMAKVLTDQRRPALDVIIASAFAAPLVHFTSHQGLMVNAYSPESGIGKTTAMKVAQAVWGDPIRAMQGLDDTINSALNKIGAIRHLPLLWDEIKTDQQTSKFVAMVFTVTGGREKSRLNADSTLKSSGVWQTMLVSASNDSILDDMIRVNKSTTAGIYRTFEYTVPPVAQSGDHVTVNSLLGKLNNNFGHAGLMYAKFLGAEYTRVEREIAEISNEIFDKYNFNNEERFWLATIATLVKGAEYANELGLTGIDIPTMTDFLVTVLGNMRAHINSAPSDVTKDIAVSAILAQFLSAMRGRNTLMTNRIWISPGKPKKDAIKILNDSSKLGDIWVQIGREDRLIRISSSAFSTWCKERGYSRIGFTTKMKTDFGMRENVHGILGGGTEIVGAKEYLLEINLNDVNLAEFVE